MDAFEQLVATLLRLDGYWVQPSFKVGLTKEDKRAIGRPSSPRWEIDVVGYKAAGNEVLAVECKSFLDSPGVYYRDGTFKPPERYKLFSDPELRRVVLGRLTVQLATSGACLPGATAKLCLATGRIAGGTDRSALSERFAKERWLLLDDRSICRRLEASSHAGYENDAILLAAKILLRSA